MALSIFNTVTFESRLATDEELAALHADNSPEHEADESSPPLMQGFSDDDSSDGGTSDVPPSEDEPAGQPAEAPPPPFSLAEDEVLIDWETHVYDFNTGEVVPIHVPLSQQFAELRETLGSHIETLEGRIALLETAVSTQADSLLGFTVTIEYLVHLTGKTLPEVIAEAQERIREMEDEQEPEPVADEQA